MARTAWRIQVGSRRHWWQRRRWETQTHIGWPDPADLTDEAQARYWFGALQVGPSHRKRLVDPHGRVAVASR